jgi:hypothetical protein
MHQKKELHLICSNDLFGEAFLKFLQCKGKFFTDHEINSYAYTYALVYDQNYLSDIHKFWIRYDSGIKLMVSTSYWIRSKKKFYEHYQKICKNPKDTCTPLIAHQCMLNNQYAQFIKTKSCQKSELKFTLMKSILRPTSMTILLSYL